MEILLGPQWITDPVSECLRRGAVRSWNEHLGRAGCTHATTRKRREYTPKQRADAVRMVHEVGNLAKVARDLDLTESALRNWVNQAKVDAEPGAEGPLTTEEREELRRLRRENRTLQMERDFLKKAAAFFAKDQDQSSR